MPDEVDPLAPPLEEEGEAEVLVVRVRVRVRRGERPHRRAAEDGRELRPPGPRGAVGPLGVVGSGGGG
eukprot:CAMPEP_0206216254 /NCGR_PEP_ID=MMETSP0047_2-20121206/2623_1 /ASSEMBLY_ACC=CAM_ASM_000192 /TAXON_ID=195065 /ORGANISM="Chroomonas mesostigmatica_cf, Strain CCMP1168" /LENGTH=67 /DNA_ID=CAMNT_0053638589 /DNA_START=649 /DNA_END=848 /DNA_ORIENTATION=-